MKVSKNSRKNFLLPVSVEVELIWGEIELEIVINNIDDFLIRLLRISEGSIVEIEGLDVIQLFSVMMETLGTDFRFQKSTETGSQLLIQQFEDV